ncbi:hypothetical protein BDV19DRAFT_154104 [Aspergillus venezuelensis]
MTFDLWYNIHHLPSLVPHVPGLLLEPQDAGVMMSVGSSSLEGPCILSSVLIFCLLSAGPLSGSRPVYPVL